MSWGSARNNVFSDASGAVAACFACFQMRPLRNADTRTVRVRLGVENPICPFQPYSVFSIEVPDKKSFRLDANLASGRENASVLVREARQT